MLLPSDTFFLRFYFYLFMRDTERGRDIEREAGSPLSREPNAGLHPHPNPGTPGLHPEPKAEAQPLSLPGISGRKKLIPKEAIQGKKHP